MAKLSPFKHRIARQLFSLHVLILALAILPLAWMVSVSVQSLGRDLIIIAGIIFLLVVLAFGAIQRGYALQLENDVKERTRDLEFNRQKLQAALEEKNVLLCEVYHRTKNNMLVIISLLSMQMDDIVDQQARKVFADTENRIRAMAMVHEDLCRSRNLAEINLGEYLENMGRTLIETMTVDGRIGFETQCDHVLVTIDQAVPLGLVVNELITNAVKHAFPDGRAGHVRLALRREYGEVELIVADDGVGLSERIDAHRSQSFGLQITANMIEKQLRGSFRVDCRRGTEYVISFSAGTKGCGRNVGNDTDC